jgi:hypothetical protein
MPYVNEIPKPKGFIKSNYKLLCHICNCVINRGDKITQLAEYGGMTLRCRVSKNGGFYTPDTGSRWIHKNCTPSSGFSDFMAVQWANESNRIMDNKTEYIRTHLNLDQNLSINEIIKEGEKRQLTSGNKTLIKCVEEIADNIQAAIDWENSMWDNY